LIRQTCFFRFRLRGGVPVSPQAQEPPEHV